MKRRVSNSGKRVKKTNGTPMAEAIVSNPFDAMECIQTGNAMALGRYLREDVCPILDLLAHQLEAGNLKKSKRRLPIYPKVKEVEEPEWESETNNTRECLRAGNAAAAVSFLRDFTRLIAFLGKVLDPWDKSEAWQLIFWRGRGKPADDPIRKVLKESAIKTEVRIRTNRGEKLEAVVQDLMTKLGKSRASIFRSLGSNNDQKKRNK